MNNRFNRRNLYRFDDRNAILGQTGQSGQPDKEVHIFLKKPNEYLYNIFMKSINTYKSVANANNKTRTQHS